MFGSKAALNLHVRCQPSPMLRSVRAAPVPVFAQPARVAEPSAIGLLIDSLGFCQMNIRCYGDHHQSATWVTPGRPHLCPPHYCIFDNGAMTGDGGTGSTHTKQDWHSALLQCFRHASAAEGTSTGDVELLAAIVGDLADCSAQECVTFLLPALDRHAGRPPDEACWSPVDAAVLRGLAVALLHVRPRQRLRTLGICLEALLRRLTSAALAYGQHQDLPSSLPANSYAAPCEPAACATQPSATHPAAGDIARDVSDFVLSAAEQLREGSATDAAVPAGAVLGHSVGFVCFALADLASVAATLPQHDQHFTAPANSSSSCYGEHSMAGNPLQEAYGPCEPIAASLLQTLPKLGCSSTDDLYATVSGLSADETDDADNDEAQARSSLGQAAAMHAAFCCPDIVALKLPDDPNSRLSLALGATQVRDGCFYWLRPVWPCYDMWLGTG